MQYSEARAAPGCEVLEVHRSAGRVLSGPKPPRLVLRAWAQSVAAAVAARLSRRSRRWPQRSFLLGTRLVGRARFELAVSWSQTRRFAELSYRPPLLLLAALILVRHQPGSPAVAVDHVVELAPPLLESR